MLGRLIYALDLPCVKIVQMSCQYIVHNVRYRKYCGNNVWFQFSIAIIKMYMCLLVSQIYRAWFWSPSSLINVLAVEKPILVVRYLINVSCYYYNTLNWLNQAMYIKILPEVSLQLPYTLPPGPQPSLRMLGHSFPKGWKLDSTGVCNFVILRRCTVHRWSI